MLFSLIKANPSSTFEWDLTYDRGPGVLVLHRHVEDPGRDNRAISSMEFHWLHQQLFTPFFQQFGSSCGHRGHWEETEMDLEMQTYPDFVLCICILEMLTTQYTEFSCPYLELLPLMVTLNLRESWPPLVDTLHSHNPFCWALRWGIWKCAVLLFESMTVREAWELHT